MSNNESKSAPDNGFSACLWAAHARTIAQHVSDADARFSANEQRVSAESQHAFDLFLHDRAGRRQINLV